MAWIKSKKIYTILNGTEEGKDIIEKAPNLSDEELQRAVDTFFKNMKQKKPDDKEAEDEDEPDKAKPESEDDDDDDKEADAKDPEPQEDGRGDAYKGLMSSIKAYFKSSGEGFFETPEGAKEEKAIREAIDNGFEHP